MTDDMWQNHLLFKARALGLLAEPCVSTEGIAVKIQNAVDPWEHKGTATAVLSQGLGQLFRGVIVRWTGVKTLRTQREATQWFASSDAALEDVLSRYAREDAVWRLGG